MRNYFTNKHTKERRLIGFAETPESQSETQEPKPEKGGDTPDPSVDSMEEAKAKLNKNLEKGDSPQKVVDDAAKTAAQVASEGAVEGATEGEEGAKEAKLAAGNASFTQMVEDFKAKNGTEPTLEDKQKIVAEINGQTPEDGVDFILNAEGTALEVDQLFEDETRKAVVDAFREIADFIREIMEAITQGFNGGAGTGGPEGGPGSAGNTGEDDPGGNTEDDLGGAGSNSESGPEGDTEGLSDKAKNTPKEAIDKLGAQKGELEAELAKILAEGGVDKDEDMRVSEIGKELDAINTKMEQLEGIIQARKAEVAKVWTAAMDASGLDAGNHTVTDIACEDGNTLTVTLAEGALEDADTAAQLTKAGFEKGSGNTWTMNVPGQVFGNIEQGFQKSFNDLAKLPISPTAKPKDEAEGGDLLGGAEDKENKEASPETLEDIKKLNEQLKNLVEKNGKFMDETPIGKIFSKMEYKAVGNEIMLNIPAEAAGQLRDIMKANGREVTKKDDGSYSIEGYPDGTTVDMPATGAADYPSRLAWGGTDGDPKSQFARAESGMNQWSNIVSKEPPADTELVEAEDNADMELSDTLSEGGAKVKAALDALKGRLGDAVDESTFGQFVNSLTVKSVGDNIALVSNADAATFSHIHNQMGIKSLLAEPLTTHGGDGYVMQLEEGRADNLVYNLERWAAMMGSTPEGGKGGDLGPEVGKNEKPKEDEGPKEDPEQIKKDYEKALAAMKSGVENLKFHVQSESGGVDALNDDGSVNPGSTLESILKDIDGLVNNPDLKIPDGRNLGSDLATMLDASDLFDKFDAGDAEYQIFMDENGIGVERIKPEKEEPADEA